MFVANDPNYDADEWRTKRAFVGFLSSVLGVDQTGNNVDYYAANRADQYIIGNPDGSYSALGQPVSNKQAGTVAGIPTGFLLLAGLALLLLR